MIETKKMAMFSNPSFSFKFGHFMVEVTQIPLKIIKGYSRDHRLDLKQFILDLIVSSDGDIPLFLRVADGNEHDKAVFGKIASEYKSMIDFETMIVGDSALYTENNLKLMSGIEWLSRIPFTIKEAKNLAYLLSPSDLTPSSLEGYSWCEVRNNYADIEQRWLVSRGLIILSPYKVKKEKNLILKS